MKEQANDTAYMWALCRPAATINRCFACRFRISQSIVRSQHETNRVRCFSPSRLMNGIVTFDVPFPGPNATSLRRSCGHWDSW